MDKHAAKLIDQLLERVINQAGIISGLRRQQLRPLSILDKQVTNIIGVTLKLSKRLDALESPTQTPCEVSPAETNLMCQGRLGGDRIDCPLGDSGDCPGVVDTEANCDGTPALRCKLDREDDDKSVED
jgi:hypothetical protein